MVGFSGILDTGKEEELKMTKEKKQIDIWKRIVSRFVVILNKLVNKGKGSPKI